MTNVNTIQGTLTVELFNEDGELLERFEGHNVVTQAGEQMYGERGGGVASPPAAPTGMRLGTGAGLPTKTGVGATLTTYLTGSNKAFDSTYPQSALGSSGRRITYKCTYGAGLATSTDPITEAVLVNDTIATNATSTSNNTISRISITGINSKTAGQTLTCTWSHDINVSDPTLGGNLPGLSAVLG